MAEEMRPDPTSLFPLSPSPICNDILLFYRKRSLNPVKMASIIDLLQSYALNIIKNGYNVADER